MLRNWRTWVLIVLFVAPLAVYVSAGSVWLWERGWLWISTATLASIFAYSIFALLADRWTRSAKPLLPPLDWEVPKTFSTRDRAAWEIVEGMSRRADEAAIEKLSEGDIYIETGRELANALARHYHPNAKSPVDNVPVVELLTALELAAEDLNGLCREVPRRRHHHRRALEAGRPGGQLRQPGQRDLHLPAAALLPGGGGGAAGDTEINLAAGLEEYAAHLDAMVLPGPTSTGSAITWSSSTAAGWRSAPSTIDD